MVSFEVAPGVRQAELEAWDFPRLDEIYMIEAYPSSVAFERAKASEIDTAHLLKNQEYWVRKATKLQGCTQLAGLTTQSQLTKEVDGRLVPVITKPFLDIVISNIDTDANCTFTYEVFMDETTLVASGGPTTLDPCGFAHIVSEIPLDLPPCIHSWQLVVHAATGDNVYRLEAAYLIADTNGRRGGGHAGRQPRYRCLLVLPRPSALEP